MIAFITGGTGFIGSFLAEKLASEGWQVHCLVRKTSSLKWLEGVPVKLVKGDLFDHDSIVDPLKQATHVFHLAGVTKGVTEQDYFYANSDCTRSLLEACAKYSPQLRRFLFVSSIAAGGPSMDGRLLTEADEPNPISIYGRSKLEAEKACASYRSQLPITVVRPPVVYGPRDRDVYEYFKQVKLGVRLKLGSVERWTSMIHVYDLVRGMVVAATHPKGAGETYYLINPEPYNWSALGEAITTAMNRKSISIMLPEWLAPIIATVSGFSARLTGKPALLNHDKVREMRYTHWVFSGEKARKEIGFITDLSLKEGLEITVQWYQQNSWL